MPTLAELQLFLIRVYIGLDFFPHFYEKLFGNTERYNQLLVAFHDLGIADPTLMVTLAGLCELGAFFGFTFGFLTRFAAFGTGLYLVISLFLGNHHLIGFMWGKPGGGWEFPAMWAFLAFSFMLTGGGRWSLDYFIRKHFNLPKWIRWIFA